MQVGHRDRPEWASYRFWPRSQFEHCERSIRAAKAARCAPSAKHALTRLMKSCQMPMDAANGWSQAGQRSTSPINETDAQALGRSEEHTSELQSLMRISYAVFCLKKTIRSY